MQKIKNQLQQQLYKVRLDNLLMSRYPEYSRAQIQSLIKLGAVLVNGEICLKSGILVDSDITIEITNIPRYVSRAGYKLEKALNYFNLDVSNLIALDAGISTGGFTDCLLQNNIKKVYGIEVGSGQTHEKIKNNPHVILFENTNLRTLTLDVIKEQVDLITLDLSFISVLKVMPVVCQLLKKAGKLIVLVKPQFESEGKYLNKRGIIKNAKIHKIILVDVLAAIKAFGFSSYGYIESPIEGGSGNKEFLAYFIRTCQKS